MMSRQHEQPARRETMMATQYGGNRRVPAAYRGDIYALEPDREELVNLGVEIGSFNSNIECFEDCRLTPLALRRLQFLSGKYLWDLSPSYNLD